MSPARTPATTHQGNELSRIIFAQRVDGAGGTRPNSGLAPLVELVIRPLTSPMIGSRNSFRELLRLDDFASADPVEKIRLWLLLTAVGETPGEWGITDLVLPPIWRHNARRLVLDRRAMLDSGKLGTYREVAAAGGVRRRSNRDNRLGKVRTRRIQGEAVSDSGTDTGPVTIREPLGIAA